MVLSRHMTSVGPRWALDGRWLPQGLSLTPLLALPLARLQEALRALVSEEPAEGPVLAPVEADWEVWASGVTYRRSREARERESVVKDVYERVYEAERPELFFKAVGWRVVGPGGGVRVRQDSHWTVPEPEVALLVNARGEIMGYTVGNDMSARDIEGENPLYLPQAKVYEGACALGPGIRLGLPTFLRVRMEILREESRVFYGESSTEEMHRTFQDLISWLFRELSFPKGVYLMTGTGIVPPDEFSLRTGDRIRIWVEDLCLENTVEA